MRIDGGDPLNMPALIPATTAERRPITTVPPSLGIASSSDAGAEQALDGVTMLQDPDLSFWPSFLAGRRYEDVELPLTGRTEPGAFDKGIWVPHIRQGALGDCWYMGALASLALAKDPKYHPAIRRIDEDTVALKFGDREVGISDMLPIRRDGKLAFGRQNAPHFNATWPAYYEKAAAAIRGSYGALDGGWPSEAFEMILGTAPRQVDRPADIVGYVGASLEAGLPVAITTRPDQSELMDEVGIASNHTYAVRKMVTISRTGEPVVAVKLWNPWGAEHPRALTAEQLEAVADSVTTPEETFGWNGVA